jgi:hypothetical protein
MVCCRNGFRWGTSVLLTQTPYWSAALIVVLRLRVVKISDEAAVHQLILEHDGGKPIRPFAMGGCTEDGNGCLSCMARSSRGQPETAPGSWMLDCALLTASTLDKSWDFMLQMPFRLQSERRDGLQTSDRACDKCRLYSEVERCLDPAPFMLAGMSCDSPPVRKKSDTAHGQIS